MAVSNFFKNTRRETLLKMTENKLSNRFKSYVGIDDHDIQSVNNSVDDSLTDLSPSLLAGEVVIAEAKNVLMFAQVSEMKHGKSGILSVTNFKLSFITTEDKLKDEISCQQNALLGEYDVCLSNVDVVYQTAGDKKRKLIPGNNVTDKVKGLHIVCKNMKVLTFSFKFSPVGHGKTLTNALLHHAFPTRHQLLFAYDYRESYYNCQRNVCLFREADDWQRELKRTNCGGWRLCAANQSFLLSTSLPQWIVVPAALLDWQVSDAARHFRANRPPVWCWGSFKGAALVRMADIQPTITTREKENVMLENIRKSHPALTQPHIIDLSKDLPSAKDIQISYLKLRDLCTPESVRQFWLQDGNFLHFLEGSRWLHHISQCLASAVEVAENISRGVTVVLQEGDGRDLSCVVSSLAQLLLDSHWRTLEGFQTLVQKEWVALGHPFCTRLGHVLSTENEQSSELLFFFDCVWQLMNQFPAAFEFSETYLTSLWDASHISVFDTFLFNCERDRALAENDPNNPLTLRSVWDWGEQFSDHDISLFGNPLFSMCKGSDWLRPRISVPMMEVWTQCYFRWLPLIEIPGGGRPQWDLQHRQTVAEIKAMQRRLRGEDGSLDPKLATNVGSFFPYSQGGHHPCILLNSSITLNCSFVTGDSLLDSQSILNAD